jgi:glycosyltransferase involved in cell wall biosynthesis
MDIDVSVIVPLHRPTPVARRCLDEVAALQDVHYELIVVSDQAVDGLPPMARPVVTGARGDTSPAEKRDAAIEHVRGAVCAFLDDDAYPAANWLERALATLQDPTIDAVGGPGVTPPGSSLRERLGGAFYESRLGSGSLRHRFRPENGMRDIDDWPAYNFFVRTDVLRSIGGWASRFYGGEDTKVCLALVQAGHRIVYDPAVIVYHFRRPMFRAHMRQVGNVGRHRGYFVRAFPETSARPLYFAPSLALLAAPVVLAWALRRRERLVRVGAAAAAGAGGIAVSALRDGEGGAVAALLPAALVAGHAAYGAGFLRGLATRELDAM